jgi:hypothetical protein
MTGEDTTHVSGCWDMRALCVYHEGECLKKNGRRKRKGEARLIFSNSSGGREKKEESYETPHSFRRHITGDK